MKFKQSLFYLLLSAGCCATNLTEGMFQQNNRSAEQQPSLVQRLENTIANSQEKSIIIFGAHPLQQRHIGIYEGLAKKCGQLTYVDMEVPHSNLISEGFNKTAYIISNGKLVEYEPVSEIYLKLFWSQDIVGDILDSTHQPMVVGFTKNNVTVIHGDFNSYITQKYFKQTSFRRYDLAIFDYYVTTIPDNVELPLIKFIWEYMLSPTGVIAIDKIPFRSNILFTEYINESHRKFIDLFIPPIEERDRCILLSVAK